MAPTRLQSPRQVNPANALSALARGYGTGMSDDPDLRPGDEAPPESASVGENLCPECGGDGVKDGAECPACGGTGRVTEAVGGG